MHRRSVSTPTVPIVVATLLAVLALASCSPSTPAPEEPSAAQTTDTTVPEPSDDPSVVGPPLSERTQAPTDPPQGDSFTFDEAARFDDGLQFEIVEARAAKAGADDEGADGTDGEIVVVDILLSNDTTSPFNARTVTVQGFYGAGVGAPLVLDSRGQYIAGFDDDVAAGQEVQGTFAFAIPKTELRSVAFEIDCNDDHAHPPIQFTGSVS